MASPAFLFIGSLTAPTPYFRDAHGKGIAVFAFDSGSGACSSVSVTGGIVNPTYLSFDPLRSCLCANSEVAGWNAGTVTAYRFDPANGSLRFINSRPTLGGIAAHNSLSRDGRFLLVANYGDGPVEGDQSIAVFPLRDDGGLEPARASLAHLGSGPNQERQERPHAHCIIASPDNGFVVVADLGTDTVSCHRLAADGSLMPDPSPLRLLPGSGPRQIAFHASGRFACVINELDSTIAALAYDGAGRFNLIGTAPTIPAAAASGENYPSELQFSRDGRFLYGSNRGHDSIAIYGIDGATGRLVLIGHQACGGKTPRSFAIDPTGRWLLVANQNSDCIAIFEIDPRSGGLSDTGRRIEVGTPMCVKFSG